jgi:hypothetical protein
MISATSRKATGAFDDLRDTGLPNRTAPHNAQMLSVKRGALP